MPPVCQKSTCLVCANLALADEADEPGHGFAGINRVEEDALVAGCQADRFPLGRGQNGIATPQKTSSMCTSPDSEARSRPRKAAVGASRADDCLAQMATGLVHADAQHLPSVTTGFGADDQCLPGCPPELVAKTTRSQRTGSASWHLLPQFLKGQGIGRGAHGVGAAIGYDIGFSARSSLGLLRRPPARARDRRRLPMQIGAEQGVQQQVAGPALAGAGGRSAPARSAGRPWPRRPRSGGSGWTAPRRR